MVAIFICKLKTKAPAVGFSDMPAAIWAWAQLSSSAFMKRASSPMNIGSFASKASIQSRRDVLNKRSNGLRQPKQSPSNNAPRRTSIRTAPAGETPNISSNGKTPLPPTPSRSLAPCQCRSGHHACFKVLEPIWTTRPETASRLRGRIESILDWAKVRGYREGENPARWRGHLDKLFPPRSKVRKTKHHLALPYMEVSALMADLQKREGIGARALSLPSLTAARSGRGPGGPMGRIRSGCCGVDGAGLAHESRQEHRVPLAPGAIRSSRIGRAGKRRDRFPWRQSWPALSAEKAMWKVLKPYEGSENQPCTDFRSIFAIGRPSEPIIQTMLLKWRSPIRSATRWRPPIVAVIYSKNAKGSWMNGQGSVQGR